MSAIWGLTVSLNIDWILGLSQYAWISMLITGFRIHFVISSSQVVDFMIGVHLTPVKLLTRTPRKTVVVGPPNILRLFLKFIWGHYDILFRHHPRVHLWRDCLDINKSQNIIICFTCFGYYGEYYGGYIDFFIWDEFLLTSAIVMLFWMYNYLLLCTNFFL